MPGVQFEPCPGTNQRPDAACHCVSCGKDGVVIQRDGTLRRHKAWTDEDRAKAAVQKTRAGGGGGNGKPAPAEPPPTEVRCRFCGQLLDIAFQAGPPRVLYVDSCEKDECHAAAKDGRATGAPF